MEHAGLTQEGDIYIFGMSILQVICSTGFVSAVFLDFVQVLTGELPFHGSYQSQVVWLVMKGQRPQKPPNAPAIGFSDSLWDFVQRCWDGERTRRPTVAEVVDCLGQAAKGWPTLMPVSVISLVNPPLNLPPLR